MSKEFSILIGGKAGDGIRQTGANIASLFNELGYYIFVYEDYPSVIRGGHNFSIIRASEKKVLAHDNEVDILVALDQNTVDQHIKRLKKGSLIIFDSNTVKAKGAGFEITDLVKKRELPSIARNTAIFSILGAVLGIEFKIVEKTIKSFLKSKIEENIALSKEAYNLGKLSAGTFQVARLKNKPQELMTGNEALAIGAIKGGLEFYSAYPMTPSTSLLNFLAKNHKKNKLKVIQAENEISAIGMIQGAAYAGKRAMTGTSGGGFALMVEHLSLAGQAEIPTVIMLGQRPGPATGLPTYTGQGELLFSIYAGHGEFPKVVVAPGDLEEAIELTRDAQNLAWQFQVPVIILGDKHLCESTYSVEPNKIKTQIIKPKLWGKKANYQRYLLTSDGVSPLAFPGQAGTVIKSNSYEHDEYGISTELADLAVRNVQKRKNKMVGIVKELRKRHAVKVYGNKKSQIVLLAWGSTKGSVIEAGINLGLKIVQPLYLYPLPVAELSKQLKGAKKVIGIECNATGQLASLMAMNGIKVDKQILKYDGRPFTVKELEKEIKKII